ncbi:MAG: hypothetical protein ACI35R_01885 [Bacillus sp. (in: firmicutes)]
MHRGICGRDFARLYDYWASRKVLTVQQAIELSWTEEVAAVMDRLKQL